MKLKTHIKKVRTEAGKSCPENIRPLTPDDYPTMHALYEKYSSGLNGPVVRSREYFDQWCRSEMKNPAGLFRNGTLCGYICSNGAYVTELICEPSDADMLLDYVADKQDNLTIPAFVCTDKDTISEDARDGWMIKLLEPVNAVKVILNDTAEIAEYINSSGGIIIWNCDDF